MPAPPVATSLDDPAPPPDPPATPFANAPEQPPPPPPDADVTSKVDVDPLDPGFACVDDPAPPAPTTTVYVEPGVSVRVAVLNPPAPPPPPMFAPGEAPPPPPPATIRSSAEYGPDWEIRVSALLISDRKIGRRRRPSRLRMSEGAPQDGKVSGWSDCSHLNEL